MQRERNNRVPRPLDAEGLQRLAVHYVGRYATTRAKLRDYLKRKVRERGWAEETPPAIEQLAERLATLGYVDDAAFAASRAGTLSRRGYGQRRIDMALNAAGIEAETASAVALDDAAAEIAAARFAERRKFGVFAPDAVTPELRRKHFAAMIRAGHSFAHARRFTDAREQDTD